MKQIHEDAYTIPKIFVEVVKVNPTIFVLQYAISIIGSILLGLFIAQLQVVFDNTAYLVENPTSYSILTVIWSLLLIFVYKFGSESLEIVNGYLGNAYYSRCAAHFLHLYNEKIGEVRAIAFEDEKNLDLFSKALEGAVAGRGMLHVIMDVLTMYIPYFITVGVFMAHQDKFLLLIFALIALPIVVTNQIKKRFNIELHSKAVKPRRRKEEYASYISDQKYFKEVRTSGLFVFFYRKFENARAEFNKFFLAYSKKTVVVSLITKIITLTGFLAVLYILIERMLSGVISIGAFGAIFYSLDDVYSMMEEALVTRISEYNEKVPLIKAFICVLNEKSFEKEKNTETTEFNTLELENVSFMYPNSNRQALHNVNLSICKNDKVAIVGYNGSGKSTLAKILIGLYSPTEGNIVMDHRRVGCADPQKVSVLFQNFNRYKDTVYNNIQISDLGKQPGTTKSFEEVTGILRKVQLNLSGPSNDADPLETLCAREFGGIDLSGGEWQRIATARMLYRDRDFVILDEPTSEIDPLSEHQLFKLFEEELKEKTAIIITHRMTSIHFCNKIVVMHDGEVAAVGDHETLMRTSALYYQLYNTLEKNYE